jgi:hypothetical protein
MYLPVDLFFSVPSALAGAICLILVRVYCISWHAIPKKPG